MNRFYICEHCGNVIGLIHDAGVPMMCCGQKMTKLEAGVVEASHEKHIPVVSVENNLVKRKSPESPVKVIQSFVAGEIRLELISLVLETKAQPLYHSPK